MANEAIPVVTTVLVAAIAAWVAWWGSTPRRTRRLKDKLDILSRLPQQSSQHKALSAHIDQLVEDEILTDRADSQSSVLVLVLATFGLTWMAWEVAQDYGGTWWGLFYELAAGSVFLIGLGIWAWVRRRKRQKGSPDPSTQ